jgi:hypothetical protein
MSFPFDGAIAGILRGFAVLARRRGNAREPEETLDLSPGGPNGPRTLLYSDIPRGYKGCIDQIALKSPAGLDSSALQSVRSSPTDVIPETPKLHPLPKKRLRGPTGSSSDPTREAGSWYEALVLVRYGEVGPPASFRNLKLLSEGDLEAYTECLLDTLPDRARIEHGPRAATH